MRRAHFGKKKKAEPDGAPSLLITELFQRDRMLLIFFRCVSYHAPLFLGRVFFLLPNVAYRRVAIRSIYREEFGRAVNGFQRDTACSATPKKRRLLIVDFK